ncbi:hypothetical protein FACS1894187_22790 [Synergistales bacterium]|nr:hypothetical protein FACS1894187_22790 [Synergistales bacterium]
MMKMLKLVTIAFVLAAFSLPASAAILKVDEFIPPVQASDEAEKAEQLKVQEPDGVKEVTGEITGKPAVSAATAQDAINYWVEKREAGFEEVVFPSGFGFVSTGVGTYASHENPVATRIEKRNAYNKAYNIAKSTLAEGLNGSITQSNEKIFDRVATVNTATDSLANIEEGSTERIRQRVDGYLRGFVVYDVFDDTANSRVYVTIVTTPKTQGNYNRPDTSSLSAASVQEGLAQVLAEVEQGLTPPVGGMTVFVPATGELAFVGFGSAVVGRHSNSAAQAKLELNSERVARMRAKDALCGVIIGEAISATDTLDSETSSIMNDFDELSKSDPIVKNDPNHPGYVKLNRQKNEFKSAEANGSVITSARKGVLPPGVKQQAWMDDDKAFSYAVAIYLPSTTEHAAAGAESMRDGVILQDVGGGKSGAAAQSPANTKPKKEEIKQGPSGTVQKVDGL